MEEKVFARTTGRRKKEGQTWIVNKVLTVRPLQTEGKGKSIRKRKAE